MRERFFDLADAETKFVAMVGGAAALYKSFGDLKWVALLVSITSALSLVVGYAKKARVHADLAKAFISLEAELLDGHDWTEEELAEFEAKLVRCELNEPRTLGVVMRRAHNEIVHTEGKPTLPISFERWLLGSIFDFDMSRPSLLDKLRRLRKAKLRRRMRAKRQSQR
jgi:hypothetical protein